MVEQKLFSIIIENDKRAIKVGVVSSSLENAFSLMEKEYPQNKGYRMREQKDRELIFQ